MKKWIAIISALLLLAAGLWTAKTVAERAAWAVMAEQALLYTTAPTQLPETTALPETEAPTTIPTTEAATVPTTLPTEPTTVPTTEVPTETTAPERLTFTAEEEELLQKIGMAERGDTGCIECIALVMRTVLNRVESSKFPSTVKGVIYAQDQFTPVMDGSFEDAQPGWLCQEALEWIKDGWDESQGALYYEWCEGESWHSQNLNLLFQHCDTRFYN